MKHVYTCNGLSQSHQEMSLWLQLALSAQVLKTHWDYHFRPCWHKWCLQSTEVHRCTRSRHPTALYHTCFVTRKRSVTCDRRVQWIRRDTHSFNASVVAALLQVQSSPSSGPPRRLRCTGSSPSSRTCGRLASCWRSWLPRVGCLTQVRRGRVAFTSSHSGHVDKVAW